MSRKDKPPANGRFQKGPDPRRHKLTKADRRRGFDTTFNLVLAGVLSQAWLAKRVKQSCGRHP